MSQFCHTSIIVVQLLIHIQFFYLVKYAKKCFFPLKGVYIRNKEIKASLFAGVMIVYIESLKECTCPPKKS